MVCSNCGEQILDNSEFCAKCGAKAEQSFTTSTESEPAQRSCSVWPEWQLEEKALGKGSYGEVFKGVRKDHNVESYSAIKVISIPSNSAEIDSLRAEGLDGDATKAYYENIVNDFVGEIQLMESLKGIQNIVSVEDYKVVEKTDEIGWDIYIRMELLTPFNTYISNKTLTEEEVIKFGSDICTALEICSQRNIIHRDIKPENIFINDFGHFKLGDFGIARKMENMAGALSQKGTFNYMAPEVANSSTYDARVDTYSLGIVLYRLLNANHLPFLETEAQVLNPNERRNAVERRIRGEALPAPSEASPAMADLILRACAYNPDNRFASATEMKKALAAVANGTYLLAEDDSLDKTTSVRKAPANVDGTVSVRKAPAAANPNSGSAVGSFGDTPKKKNLIPIIAAALAVLLLVGAGIFLIPKLFNSNEATDDTASTTTESTTVDPSAEAIAEIIREAEYMAAMGDYENALNRINKGLRTYPKSEELKAKAAEYTDALNAKRKEDVLKQAAACAEAGDYLSAMEVIKNAMEVYGNDTDYQEAYDKYNAAYKAAVKEDALKKAADQAEKKDFLGAYSTIQEALAILGSDADLTAKATDYEDAYVKDIIAKADALTEEERYSAAQSIIAAALENFPENTTLQQYAEELAKYKTALLNHLAPINGSLPWNDGLPADPFGTDYSNVQNYTILHVHSYSDSFSAEYNINGEYDQLSFTVSPYSHFGQNSTSYLQIYTDGVIAYTSPNVGQKTQPFVVNVDVQNTTYLEFVVYGNKSNSCLMLSDVVLSASPDYPDSAPSTSTSLATLDTFNGGFKWNSGYPVNIQGDSYSDAKNYTLLHRDDYSYDDIHSAEYFVNKSYASLSFKIAPLSDFGTSASVSVKVYSDDNLIYTSPDITQKTAIFSTGNIDISKTTYLKIVVEVTRYHGCIIISDAMLKNK